MTATAPIFEEATVSKDKISCRICDALTHAIKPHLEKEHLDWGDIEKYKTEYPDAPTLSEYALFMIRQKEAAKQAAEEEARSPKAEKKAPSKKTEMATTAATAEKVVPIHGHVGETEYRTEKVALHEALGVPLSAFKSATGKPIMMTAFLNTPFPEYVPKQTSGYVFQPEVTKDAAMAIELNIPAYFWGHAGTGKTSLPTQICAALNRPVLRAQHTGSTEESEIVGQILANENGTYFEPGLLAMAMRHGFTYIADEYDFAFAQVLSAYQAVLEGEALVIKNATPEWRKVNPHKYFSFIGTGNTNGSGDETGLYQGTNIQNAANYSRFGIVEKVEYMDVASEVALIRAHVPVRSEDAEKMVKFAGRIREAYDRGDMPMTIGPRELISAAKVGMLRGDLKVGLYKSWINKLPSDAKDAVGEVLQRVYG